MSRRVPAQDERDAWLSLALRHAPDANADAPPALSETILREARSAVARPAAKATETATAPMRSRGDRSNRFVSAWDWLARPPMPAGFGAVMVATVVGIVWWGRPLDETLPHPPQSGATAPQTRIEAAPAVLADTRPGEREAAAVPPAALSADKSHSPPQREAKTGPAPETRPPVAAERARRQPGDSAAAPSVAPAPAMARAVQQAPEPADLRRELGASGAAVADATAQRSSQSLSAAPTAAAKTAPLAELLTALAQQPERWSWQRGSAEPQAMNPALQSWLVQLDRSTASHWGAAFAPAPNQALGTLRLLLDGVPRATLGFEAGGVRAEISAAGGAASALARVPPSVTDRLKKALDEAAP